MLEVLVHGALLLIAPPFFLGLIAKTKAWFAGRQGPPLLQPYYDLVRLLRKGAIYSRTTTWLFRAGPIGSLAALLVAGLVIPLLSNHGPLGFDGDVIAFAYLIGLSRFLTVTAALDTGSSFEGMGASREAAFSALAEPALFVVLAILCLPDGNPTFERAWGALPTVTSGLGLAPLLAAAVALFVIILAENSRIPFDDPNTHLELTMIHEVMVLDHGGPDLAFILYGGAVKLFILGNLLIHAILPFPSHGVWQGAGLLLGCECLLAVAIGIVESWTARLRLPRIPQFLVGAFAVSAVGLLVSLYRVGR